MADTEQPTTSMEHTEQHVHAVVNGHATHLMHLNPGVLKHHAFDGELTIPKFYVGKNIFITGATGFVGKVLIEKLIRCCPDVNKIYCLIRPKYKQDIKRRVNELIDSKVSWENTCCFSTISHQDRYCLGKGLLVLHLNFSSKSVNYKIHIPPWAASSWQGWTPCPLWPGDKADPLLSLIYHLSLSSTGPITCILFTLKPSLHSCSLSPVLSFCLPLALLLPSISPSSLPPSQRSRSELTVASCHSVGQ
jgi:hypothetical protein